MTPVIAFWLPAMRSALCHLSLTQLPIYYFSPLPYAVGSKGFVEHVKSALGALAKGRKAKESGDSYQLREPSAPYGEHFGVKNEDIGL